MKCLVVIAHPLRESLCNSLAVKVIESLTAAGHEVLVEDLYCNELPPLSQFRKGRVITDSVMNPPQFTPKLIVCFRQTGIVLCFPTWWFGFPAILKGWFDRAWGPGVAYDHANDLGLIKPRLHSLRKVLAITSLGSPWWVDKIVMRQPVKRVLKIAILGTCAPACHFEMLSLYKSERLERAQVERFAARVEKALSELVLAYATVLANL